MTALKVFNLLYGLKKIDELNLYDSNKTEVKSYKSSNKSLTIAELKDIPKKKTKDEIT